LLQVLRGLGQSLLQQQQQQDRGVRLVALQPPALQLLACQAVQGHLMPLLLLLLLVAVVVVVVVQPGSSRLGAPGSTLQVPTHQAGTRASGCCRSHSRPHDSSSSSRSHSSSLQLAKAGIQEGTCWRSSQQLLLLLLLLQPHPLVLLVQLQAVALGRLVVVVVLLLAMAALQAKADWHQQQQQRGQGVLLLPLQPPLLAP
jgi:hypothetical protein